MSNNGFGDLRRGNGGLQADVDADITVAQQVHQIFGGDVSSRTWSERATAQPADRGIQTSDAGADRGEGAGQPRASGVVEMSAPRQVEDQGAAPPRSGGTDGVGDAEAVDALFDGGRRDVQDPRRGSRALE